MSCLQPSGQTRASLDRLGGPAVQARDLDDRFAPHRGRSNDGCRFSVSATVPRVVAQIGNDNVDTSTALTGVFNTNNPRRAATVDGSSFYVSGQGASKTDTTSQSPHRQASIM